MTDAPRWNEPILDRTETRRQHFVPRMYLKRFTNADGKIRVFDLQEGREYVPSLNNVAVRTRFYDVSVEGHDYSAEDWLANLEGDASSVLGLLCDDPSALMRFTADQENTLARFIAALILRTPSKRQEIDNALDVASSEIERNLQGQFIHQFGEAEGRARYTDWRAKPFHERYGEKEPRQPASTTNSLLGEVQGFANLLRAAPWRIGYALGPTQLYTSDNPVSRHLPPVRPSWTVGGFSEFHYFFPLSQEVLLKIERRPDSDDPDEAPSLDGQRRKSDFSAWEVSLARHLISSEADRYVYGDGRIVPKECARSCLDRIDASTREFAAMYLGYEPNPPPGIQFPIP